MSDRRFSLHKALKSPRAVGLTVAAIFARSGSPFADQAHGQPFDRDLILPIGSEAATKGGGGKVVTFGNEKERKETSCFSAAGDQKVECPLCPRPGCVGRERYCGHPPRS